MKRILLRWGALASFVSVVFGFCQSARAQTNLIRTYNDLAAALSAGATTITNFNPTNSVLSPLIIDFQAISAPALQITSNITINAGTNTVLFEGNGTTRFFIVRGTGTLALNNIAFINGLATNGGAIYNQGTLIASNCVFQGNSAVNSNGVAGANGPLGGLGNGGNGGPGLNAAGGAIYSTGPLYVSFSIFTNNIVQAGSGGNGGNPGTSGDGNGGNAGFGGSSLGGAIYSTGITNVFVMNQFSGNQCIAGNGGTNGPAAFLFLGSSGEAGLGGTSAGGAAYISGFLYMTNCFFFTNIVTGGLTTPAQTNSSGGGENGSIGGSALGGGLFLTNTTTVAWIENSIFFYNICQGGAGGNAALTDAIGGTGGTAQGGGIWSAAGLTEIAFTTLATNYLFPGSGGLNLDSGTNGVSGFESGWDIYRQSGATVLTASIASYDTNGTNLPNLVGVTDGGYNVVSDASMTRSTIVATTKLNTNPGLDPGLSLSGNFIGGSLGTNMFTLGILGTSPAAGFVPGVPGLTFPGYDEELAARSTPTSAGAFEYNMISPIVTNLALPTIISTLPGTNFTGAGGTVAFTNLISTKDYTGQPVGYQWQFDGTNIIDDGNYFGTTTNVLTVKHVSIFNQGQYTVVISPSIYEGALTSSVVELILTNPPAIAKEPVSITRPEGGIAEFTLGVVSPLNFEYQWKLNGTNLVGGSEYTGTNSNVLLIDPATTVDAGLYQVIVSNNYGARTSAVVRLTITADHARPTITITSPKLNNIRTNGPVLTGTAVDNAQVSNVFYWITNINAGLSPVTNVMSGIASLTTNGSTNYNGPITKLWSITNAILPGTNILVVQAVGPSSNVSTFLSRRFFYEVPSKLNLQYVQNGGQGSFTGHAFIKGDNAPSNNAALNVGEGYTLVAAPNTASLLGTWSNSFGTNIAMTNGNTLKFVMESNLTIVATFVSNMFTGIRGTYNGLFYAPPLFVSNQVTTNGVTNAIYTNEAVFNSSGMLNNLVLGTQGTFTAKLLLEGNSYSFSGAFNAYGGATNTIIRTAALGGPLTVALNANTNGVGVITGTVTNTAWPGSSVLQAYLAASVPGSSNYTLLMAPSPTAPTNAPPGDSYALIAAHAGTVMLRGGLADGTTFTEAVPTSLSNNVPVYLSLYARTGLLIGWLNLTNLSNTNTSNELVWIKMPPKNPTALYPDGFTDLLFTAGSLWTNPGAITLPSSNILLISNSDLDLSYTVAVKHNDQIYNPSSTPANSLNGTVNLQTGQLQITFGNGDGNATTRGYGALLQDADFGGGYFVTKTNGGSIILDGSGNTNSSAQPFSLSEDTAPPR